MLKTLFLFIFVCASSVAFGQECSVPKKNKLSEVDAQQIMKLLSDFLESQSKSYNGAIVNIDSSNSEYDLRVSPSTFQLPLPGEPDEIEASIYMSIGYLEKQSAMTLALALTHEFGHLMGHGPTEKYFVAGRFIELAPEGEADYLSAYLLRKAFDFNPEEFKKIILYHSSNSYMSSACTKKIKQLSLVEDSITSVILSHGAALMNLTANANREEWPVLDSSDPTIVKKTVLAYPSIQSRWDSLLSGVLKRPRPRSWALLSDFE